LKLQKIIQKGGKSWNEIRDERLQEGVRNWEVFITLCSNRNNARIKGDMFYSEILIKTPFHFARSELKDLKINNSSLS
jgi:hypothetical protein